MRIITPTPQGNVAENENIASGTRCQSTHYKKLNFELLKHIPHKIKCVDPAILVYVP